MLVFLAIHNYKSQFTPYLKYEMEKKKTKKDKKEISHYLWVNDMNLIHMLETNTLNGLLKIHFSKLLKLKIVYKNNNSMLLLCIRMLLLCFLTSTSFSGSSPTRSVSLSVGTGRVEHPGNEVVLMLLHVTHMYSPCTRMYPCGALVEIATWPVSL